jgi:transposase
MRGERIHVRNFEEVRAQLVSEKDPVVKQKLSFLLFAGEDCLYFERAVEASGIDITTGYKWIRTWNELGYKGFLPSPNKGGRPPKLTDDDLEDLQDILKSKDFWTTKEVRVLIKEIFMKELSEDQVRRILKEKVGMHLSKPYPQDYRRPENAEEILKDRLEATLSELETKGYKREEIAIGFIDESSPQSTANTVRVWSFDKPHIKKTPQE